MQRSHKMLEVQMTERVKELLGILEGVEGKDRIDPLERLTNNLMSTKPGEAIKYAAEGLKTASEFQEDYYVSTFSNRLGICNYYLGNFEDSLMFYKKAAEIDNRIGEMKNYCTNISNIAVIKIIQGNYAEALESLNSCIPIEKELGNYENLSSTYNNIGNVYNKLNDNERALKYYLKALSIREEHNLERLLLSSYANIGALLRTSYESERANMYIEKGIELCDKLGQFHQKPFLLNQRALILASSGELDTALEILNQSVELNKQNGNKEGLAVAYEHIAEIYSDFQCYKESLDAHNNSFRYTRELKMMDYLIKGLVRAANSYLKIHEVEKAEEMLAEAEEYLKNYEDDNLKSDLNKIKAKYYAERGDYKKAFECSDRNSDLEAKIRDNALKQRAQELEIIYAVERKETENEILQHNNTELSEKNLRLEELNRELLETQKSLQEKERKVAVLAMAATANHEINQPLMIIKGSLELLEMELGKVSPKGSRHFKHISESVDRIQRILNTYKTVNNVEYEDYVEDNPMVSI